MKKAVITAVAVLLLLALSACGGSDKKAKPDLGAEEKKVAKTIAKSFSSSTSGALSTTEANCFADDFVDAAGLAKLKSSKLIDAKGELNQADAKFDTKLATQFAEAFLGCVDYQKKQADIIAESDPKIDATKLADCLGKEMPESYVTKLIVSSYTATADSAAMLQESQKKLETCKTKATKKK